MENLGHSLRRWFPECNFHTVCMVFGFKRKSSQGAKHRHFALEIGEPRLHIL